MKIECKRCEKLFEGNSRGGNEKYCLNCRKIHKKEYRVQWRLENKDYFKKKNKDYWEKNKEKEKMRTKEYHFKNRRKILEKMKEYRNNHKDYFKEKWEEYYKINKEKLLQRKNIWNEKHKEHNKLMSKKYYQSPRGKEIMSHHNRLKKIRIRNIIHSFSLEDWKKKVEETWGICPRCKKVVGIQNMTLDHIFPISKVPKGFVYKIEDVQPLCHICNSSKNNRIDETEMDFLIEASIEQGLI